MEQPIRCAKLDSIKNIYLRLRENGYNISENALRGWIRNGSIRSIPCGKKSLIFYDDAVAFLENYTISTAQAKCSYTTSLKTPRSRAG